MEEKLAFRQEREGSNGRKELRMCLDTNNKRVQMDVKSVLLIG